MPEEIVSLKSILKAENLSISPSSFGGELDPSCPCVCSICISCLACDKCVLCTVCAGLSV